MIKSFLGADTVDEWRPRSLVCAWGDSDSGPTGDAGGGYNASDFGGDYSGDFGAPYSSNFDSEQSAFDSGNQGFDNAGSWFDGGGVPYGDAGVGYSGFGSGGFGGGFNTGGFSSGFSDNIGGDSGTYSGYADNSIGSFGPQGGWESQLSADPNVGPGIMGYMSGMLDAPGWGAGSYGSWGGYGSPGGYGPGSGPFGNPTGGVFTGESHNSPFTAPEMDSNPTGTPGQYGTYQLGPVHDYNQGPQNLGPPSITGDDMAGLYGAMNNTGRADLGATRDSPGINFNNVFDAVGRSTLGNIDMSIPGAAGGINAPSFFGRGQEGDPGGRVFMSDRGYAELGVNPNLHDDNALDSRLGYPLGGAIESQGYYGPVGSGPQDAAGRGTSLWDITADQFNVPDTITLNDVVGGRSAIDPVSWGWGPGSNYGMAMGAQAINPAGVGLGPGPFAQAGDAGGRDTFDARFGGPYNDPATLSAIMPNQTSIVAQGDQGRDSFDSRFGGPWAAPAQWTSDMYVTDKADNSRDSFNSRFGTWDTPDPETQPLAPWDVGLPVADPRGRAERGPQDVMNEDNNYPIYDFNEYGAPNQNMGRPNNNPTIAEFLGPGRGQSQNIYAPDRAGLQVTVPGRVSSEGSRGVSGPFGQQQGRGSDVQGRMDALLSQARTAPTQAARIEALDALNGLISATYGRGPNLSVGRGPYGGDPDPFIAQMLRMGR